VQVLGQVLAEEEGALLATGGAKVERLAGEGPEVVEAAVRASDAGYPILPVPTVIEGPCHARNQRKAKPTEIG